MKKPLKMIIIVLLAIVIIGGIIFVISVNSKKTAITVEQFEEKANEKGYSIANIKNDVKDNENITVAEAAISSDYSYFIGFYTLTDIEPAKEFWNENKAEFEKDKQEENTAKEKTGKNYETYTLKSNNKYMYVIQVDNTIISLSADETKEEEIKDFLKELGY